MGGRHKNLVSPPGNIWLHRVLSCVAPKMAKMRHSGDMLRLIETLYPALVQHWIARIMNP